VAARAAPSRVPRHRRPAPRGARHRRGRVQPDADTQNAFLEEHDWSDYAAWHLGLTAGANDETKARHAFVLGDFDKVHRSALIACVYRASEWRHKKVELAAHRLLQELDRKYPEGE